MTENEAKIFIQNAMEQSRNVLAELMLIMPKVFAAKRKSLGEYYSNLENCKKEIESCEVAIWALEEIQRWHTSVVNPNIKNEFANRSTQICVNCDTKMNTSRNWKQKWKSTAQSAHRKNCRR